MDGRQKSLADRWPLDLLLDGAANRLKLPLSLCRDENIQLYFSAEGKEAGILCARLMFSGPCRIAVFSASSTVSSPCMST